MTANSPNSSGDGPGLRAVDLRGSYSNDDHPLTSFYIPALAHACRYDRMAGYFSSSSLQLAAVGARRFITNAETHNGRMRLIVGAQLSNDDIAAIKAGTASRAEAVAAHLARVPLHNTTATRYEELLGRRYLQMLAWMVREQLLEIKVGIPLAADGHPLTPDEAAGYFHSKTGILTDHLGDRVAFFGSANESAAGWLHNHETIYTAPSWKPELWQWQGEKAVEQFERHWNGAPDAGWWVTDLADVDTRLLTLINHDYVLPAAEPLPETQAAPDLAAAARAADPVLQDLADAPKHHPFTAALTAPALPLPHQEALLERAVTSFPRGYLFADPVGFGKTLEVGFTLRELLLSGQASTALILTPASVLRQWQEELAEKVGLLVPRYENNEFTAPDGRLLDRPPNTRPWSAFPVVLASSHLARRRARRAEVVAAGPWDIVVVDEAHHARRRGSKDTDTANSLLTLLQEMHRTGRWKAIYLATATPMQMNPHEVWDLLELLDLPGRWGRSARDFTAYFANLKCPPAERDWPGINAMIADYFADGAAERDRQLAHDIRSELGPVRAKKITSLGNPANLAGLPAETAAKLPDDETVLLDSWLRRHTPIRDRTFRNTRDTLRAYKAAGIIPDDVNIPERSVTDVFIHLNDDWERPLYDRIERYITRYYNAYMNEGAKALGFIMTVYRRRLTSSFYAIRKSLERRLRTLESGSQLSALLADDDAAAIEATLFELDDLDVALNLLEGEIDELRKFVTELRDLAGEDTKASRLVGDLQHALLTYDSAVVFTQYTDTLDYIRQRLVGAGHTSLGCYSGRGGEIWDGTQQLWRPVSKTELKKLFRDGQVKILLGTDSMSEGLNLQTASILFNYDMPWNLMRAEQRAGRIDRIGSARDHVQVTNYFYADTVEERVYSGIREDFADFTDIIGSAQPVLGAIESTIQQLAMAGPPLDTRQLDGHITSLRDELERATQAPVTVDDLDDNHQLDFTPLRPEVTLDDIEQILISHPLTSPLLEVAPDVPHTYRLRQDVAETLHGTWEGGHASPLVTFDRDTADERGIPLVTYGHPIFDALVGRTQP